MSASIPQLRLARMHYPVTALGPGPRLGIWTQGCPLACTGCMSRDTWDTHGGHPIAVPVLAALWRQALAAGAHGLTISGGEPLTQPQALAHLLTASTTLRDAANPTADILLYTGYEPAELATQLTSNTPHATALAACLTNVDALITGRFQAGAPTGAIWRGSANQQLLATTALGTSRYAAYLDHTPQHPPIQLGLDAAGLWLIGVPRAGQLAHLARALRRRGIALEGVSWRPPSTTAD